MANIDVSALDDAELAELIAAAQAAKEELKLKELKSLTDEYVKAVKSANYTVEQAIKLLQGKSVTVTATSAAKATRKARTPKDPNAVKEPAPTADHTGKFPKPLTKYIRPDTKFEWVSKALVKVPKKEIMEYVHANNVTYESLEA